MTSLENKVLQCASGEKRLNPDELRQYFGTYAERVVLAVLLENAEKKTVIDHFPQILKDLQAVYPNLSLKLSPKLADQIQFTYIKLLKHSTFQLLSWTRPRPIHHTVLLYIVIKQRTLIKCYFQSSILISLLLKKLNLSLKKRDFLLNYLENKS